MAEARAADPLAPKAQQGVTEIPLKIVGGNHFGRYNKMSSEQTFNMMVSDNALVDYAGYKKQLVISPNPTATGRGIFSSTIQDIMVVVVGAAAFSIDKNLNVTAIGALATSTGDVFIAENNANQIAFSDSVNIYIYDTVSTVFSTSNLTPGFTIDFTPGFIAFQNTRFICATNTFEWRLSDNNNGLSWPNDVQYVGELQTKPDTVQAVVPFPGRGNTALVFGHTVSEQWTDVGNALFPYQRSSSLNIDYGCINPASIAYQGNFIVWVGFSEEAGPVVMFSTGGDITEISTDGIDFRLSQLTAPEDCIGFLVKLDGHLIYQFTFKTDNLTYFYDFSTQTFFSASDENMNYHIARRIVYFNNTYYFVSFNDGNVYEFGTKFTNYDYGDDDIQDIPRIRYTPGIRVPSQRWFVGKSLGFTIEQGEPNAIVAGNSNMRVDLAMSRDGGVTYGSFISNDMNPTGNRLSRMIYQRLGHVNDASFQIQFWGDSRYVVFDGVVEVFI